MAARKLGKPGEQLILPGFDIPAIEKETRENVIRNEIGSGSDIDLYFKNRTIDFRIATPMVRRDQEMVTRSTSRFSRVSRPSPATQNVTRLLSLTDIPVSDFSKSNTTIIGSNPRSHLSPMTRGQGGQTSLRDSTIVYDKTQSAAEQRGILTHELAHAQQLDLGESVHARELHKTIVSSARKMVDTKDSLGGTRSSQGPVIFANDNSAVRKKGRTILARYAHKGIGDIEQLQSVSSFNAGTPIAEGSAEGYRERFQGGRGEFKSIYSPQFFAQTHGPDAGGAYTAAHQYTATTGKVVTYSDIAEATRLAGVLKSDLDDKGNRVTATDYATTHRMMQHLLEKRMGAENPAHAEEFETRMKAIEGEHVQPSLFPELAPDINQFGKAPTGTPERSRRGVALHEGARTEIPVEHTLTFEQARQNEITKARRQVQQGMDKNPRTGELTVPYFSKYRYRLQQAVGRKKAAEAERAKAEATKPSTVSSGGGSSVDIHPAVQEYIDKLVYDKKKSYAVEYAKSRASGGELPKLPAGLKPEHAENVRKRIDTLHKRPK